AVHRPVGREPPEAVEEPDVAGKPPGMKLRIAARQPAGIAIVSRRLVIERRERHDLRPRLPPTVEHVRIDEGEGGILRQRDAPAGRWKAKRGSPPRALRR